MEKFDRTQKDDRWGGKFEDRRNSRRWRISALTHVSWIVRVLLALTSPPQRLVNRHVIDRNTYRSSIMQVAWINLHRHAWVTVVAPVVTTWRTRPQTELHHLMRLHACMLEGIIYMYIYIAEIIQLVMHTLEVRREIDGVIRKAVSAIAAANNGRTRWVFIIIDRPIHLSDLDLNGLEGYCSEN